MTGEQVCKNALKFKDYVYWYGGKNQLCTTQLLNTLAKRYPDVYTASYQNKCKKDISAKKYCIDCSGLVCQALGISDIGTYAMASDKRFIEYHGAPKNGMIVWKWSHVGIYYNGKVIEARGKDYGITTNRTYKSTDWQRLYTFKGVTYNTVNKNKTAEDYLNVAIAVIGGKYGSGTDRIQKLTAEGYDAQKVQDLVNRALK